MSKILIAEDDPTAARLLQQAVTEAGHHADVTGDGIEAEQRAVTPGADYDLLLLDVMLPQQDGLSVCRAVRAAGLQIPILMLTARDTTEDMVAGLDSGADDYLVKPFRFAELMARMRALLRRGKQPYYGPPARSADADGGGGASGGVAVTAGGLTLNPLTRVVWRGEQSVALTGTEYRLLDLLMRHAGQVLPRATILHEVWQYDFGGNDNVLDVYISYLRAKLDSLWKSGSTGMLATPPSRIHTVRGVGFWYGDLNEHPRPTGAASPTRAE